MKVRELQTLRNILHCSWGSADRVVMGSVLMDVGPMLLLNKQATSHQLSRRSQCTEGLRSQLAGTVRCGAGGETIAAQSPPSLHFTDACGLPLLWPGC